MRRTLGYYVVLPELNFPFPPCSVGCSGFAPPLFESISHSQLVSKHDWQILLWTLQFLHEMGVEGMGLYLQGMLVNVLITSTLVYWINCGW